MVAGASIASAGEVSGITKPDEGGVALAPVQGVDLGKSYEISVQQSPGDPLIRGLHLPLPAGTAPISATAPGSGGTVLVETSGLGATWTFDVSGGYLNLYDPVGPGISSGSFRLEFTSVPQDARLRFGQVSFSSNGSPQPGAVLIPQTPGAETRVPFFVPLGGHNRVRMDNGWDTIFSAITFPTIAGDPASGDYSGDLFYKVLPQSVLNHPTGEMNLSALEYSVFEPDFLDGGNLAGYTISKAERTTVFGADEVTPDFTDPDLIYVPEILGVGLEVFEQLPCDFDGNGWFWTIQDSFVDPESGLEIPLATLEADGQTDYAVSFFLVGGIEEGCDITTQWFHSNNYFGGSGENAPTGLASLSGHRRANTSSFFLDDLDGAPEVSFLFDEPTLTPRVDAGADGILVEFGLAGLYLPLTNPNPARLGFALFSDAAAPPAPGVSTERAAFVWGSVGVPLPAPGVSVFGTNLLLNPADPIFAPSQEAWGFGFVTGADLTGDGSVDETYFHTNLVTITPDPSLFGVSIYAQGMEIDITNFQGTTTQVVRVQLEG